jgi:hypothetical protein
MDNKLIREKLDEIYSSKIDKKNLYFFEGIAFIKQVVDSVNTEIDLALIGEIWWEIKEDIEKVLCNKRKHPEYFQKIKKIDSFIIHLMNNPNLLSRQIGVEKFFKKYEEDEEFYESQYNSSKKAKTWERFNSLLFSSIDFDRLANLNA